VDRRVDAAAVDVGGRIVEAATEAEAVSAAARETAALWGAGADGRKFSRLVEERGPCGCPMNMTDDATCEVELRMGEEETIWEETIPINLPLPPCLETCLCCLTSCG
jgi:hypothetical protein